MFFDSLDRQFVGGFKSDNRFVDKETGGWWSRCALRLPGNVVLWSPNIAYLLPPWWLTLR